MNWPATLQPNNNNKNTAAPYISRVAICIAIASMTLQVAPLFFGRVGYIDWLNHVWLVEYFSRFFEQHLQFPTSVDISQEFGSPLPLFYGAFLYPIVSLLALAVGSDAALRLFCGALLAAPFLIYAAFFTLVTKDRILSILLSVAVNSSIYQLTNLYARGAITEFCAHQLLITSFAIVAYGMRSEWRFRSAVLSLGFACFTLSMGMHPITLYLFFTLNSPLALYAAIRFLKGVHTKTSIFLAMMCSISFALLLPMIFAIVKYAPRLQVSNSPYAGRLYYFPESIDSAWGKAGLFFIDPRVLIEGVGSASTPFLESPYSIALVLVFAAMMVGSSKSRAPRLRLLVPVLLTILVLSVAAYTPSSALHDETPNQVWMPAAAGILYAVLAPIQFAYRLSNPFAVCLTLAITFVVFSAGQRNEPILSERFPRFIVLGAALIGFIGCAQKYAEAYFEFEVYPSYRALQSEPYRSNDTILLMDKKQVESETNNVAVYPASFYGSGAYAMTGGIPTVSADVYTHRQVVRVIVSSWNSPIPVQCVSSCALLTNVAPTDFNVVTLDGRPVDRFASSIDSRQIILADAGSYTLRLTNRGRVPRLIGVSMWLSLVWLVGGLFLACCLALFSRPQQTGPRES
jgi:hypothetical protein